MENVLHAGMGGIEMSEWIEYTGSDKQIEEIKTASNGVMFEYVGGIGTD